MKPQEKARSLRPLRRFLIQRETLAVSLTPGSAPEAAKVHQMVKIGDEQIAIALQKVEEIVSDVGTSRAGDRLAGIGG
ncbi:hypothetical protein [Candidatus Amarobacter glycogenicus]|uniref:hypothetical protein n=1 Tax=Candidatus Amarobacter glycogenicus TaxID=3140699 RepID=UPI003135E471|nr:hypothetical protein [Dehalococcoidia bacterium]